MADDRLQITVSYSGREKRIPLVVQPSIELSDVEVDQAELELCGIVRHIFNIPAEAGFSLYEAETDRTLTKESFRDPSYIRAFPKFWYLTVDKTAAETTEEEETQGDKISSSYDPYSEGLSDFDESLPSLAELCREAKYRNIRLRAEPSGLFRVTLRYFSIQPACGPERVDSPSEQPLFGGDSQNSQQSSGSVDVLSTIFVYEVEGAGLEAGLNRCDTVHMINGESIIRSSFTELQDLLAQCGSEITLMVLPKEQDDLQFIYPQYTQGSVGEYTSGEERVIARDIPIVVGSGASSPGEEREPLGPYHFNGSGSSLDHTHSNSSNEHLHTAADDPLVSWPIHEIPVHSPSRSSYVWSSGRGTGSNSQLDRLVEEEPVANGDVRYVYQSGGEIGVDPSWYQDPEEEDTASHPVKERVVRAHSQDSAVLHRVGLEPTSEEEVSHSQPMYAEDLGVVKISRRSDKSLEMLTSLSTAPQPQRGIPQPKRGMRRIRSDDVIGKRGLGMRRHSEQNPDLNTTPTAKVPPNSYSKTDDTLSSLPASKPGSSGPKPRKSSRSYSSQHHKLHKSRSRLGDSEAAAKTAESLRRQLSQPSVVGAELEREEREAHTLHSLSPLQDEVTEDQGEEGESPNELVTTPTIQVGSEDGRGGERKESRERGRDGSHTLRHSAVSPPVSPSRFQSTTMDPRTIRTLNPGPGDYHSHLQYLLCPPDPARRLPIAKTRSAQTTYGKEVNIDEVVEMRASQNASTSHSVHHRPSHSFTADSEVATGDLGEQGVGIFPQPWAPRRHSLTHEAMGSTSRAVPCHGLLNKKQVSDGQGKKGGTRSWKTFYTVLAGSHMVFYKDKKDADANKPCDEPPLEVVPGRADLTHGYTKRKFVFRVMCGQGAELLMQCEDSQSMLNWVSAILRLNGGSKMVVPSPKTDLLTPGSPHSGRRGSSPNPTSSQHQRPTRKKRLGLGNLKNALRTKKTGNSQPSFGQLLADCPVSGENKWVPLVVELCVREVEEHGLDVEGLYRKPGQRSVIRNMVSEIDKGRFECEDYGDIHTIGSLLKKFFQELPDSLIPGDRYKEFLEVIREGQGEMQQVTRLRGLVFHLPTAHYHTLKYLMHHLNTVAEHAEQNKMVLRNVAMVFGPTLMLRTSPAEEFDLVAMNNSFTVIELLCRDWHNIFDSELCHEEEAIERERERERQRDAQREGEGGLVHRTSSDPAVNNIKVKKDNALLHASPRMVRRIKNQFTGGASTRKAPDRNSYSGGEALLANSYSRKQHNRSDTLPPTFISPQGSLLPPSSSGPPPANRWSRAGSSGTLQAVRHYETEGYAGDLNPHTRYTQSAGREEARREHTGSIWKKEQQKGRGSGRDHVEKREGPSRTQLLSSHPPPPPIAHQRELLTSYQQPSYAPSHRHSHSSPSHELLHRSTTLPVSPESRNSQPLISAHPPTVGHAPSSPGMHRKISYNLAVGEGYQRQPHTRSYQKLHRKTSVEGHAHPEDFREKEFSHSYAPQSTVRTTNLTKSGVYSSHQSGSHSRGYQYGPQRGDRVQRSRHNETYH